MLVLERDFLWVKNIGLGPAENIAIRLEWRSGGSSRANPPRLDLDERLNTVGPLPAGGKGVVRQWKTAEKAVAIYDDHWLVISYDDLFGRHFETEARYIEESDRWVTIKTKQVKEPRPRVREDDYYKNIF